MRATSRDASYTLKWPLAGDLHPSPPLTISIAPRSAALPSDGHIPRRVGLILGHGRDPMMVLA
jgi:hypothetical protein